MNRHPPRLSVCRWGAVVCALLSVLASCGGNPAWRTAEEAGFAVETVAGDRFIHRVFVKPGPGAVLHVYLEGDGRPWRTRNRIALDPTPDNPIVLELMALDAGPAVYLGRPCYYRVEDPRCSPLWWTDRRYAPEVVASLDRLLDRYAGEYRGVVLVGHSGGGALAMLLAQRRTDILAVVTLAGNLDTAAWAARHGYTPLHGSLDPARQPPLDPAIRQLHLAGADDDVIPVGMLESALAGQPGAELRIIAHADHSCCWRQVWPDMLALLASEGQPVGAGAGGADAPPVRLPD
jgi:pimeloyl-ACP methyl ester carboxylesterase